MSVHTLKTLIQSEFSIWESLWHGINHWEQVSKNAQMIGWNVGADMEVVEYFAYLHDCQRWSEGEDPCHGPRAAWFAKTHRELFDLSDTQFHVLLRAVSGHTAAKPGCKAGEDPTLATCWDADRLDIGRVGIVINPDLLFTEMAKELAYLELVGEEN